MYHFQYVGPSRCIVFSFLFRWFRSILPTPGCDIYSGRLGRRPLRQKMPFLTFRPEADSAYVQSSFSGLVVTPF